MIKNSLKILKSFKFSTLSQSEYIDLATKKISQLVSLSQQQLDSSQKQIDIYSTDKVLRISSPAASVVINTQTPNRQLWYSCTASGPQRFDYNNKQKQKQGKWVNQNGTTIQEVLLKDIKSAFLI